MSSWSWNDKQERQEARGPRSRTGAEALEHDMCWAVILLILFVRAAVRGTAIPRISVVVQVS